MLNAWCLILLWFFVFERTLLFAIVLLFAKLRYCFAIVISFSFHLIFQTIQQPFQEVCCQFLSCGLSRNLLSRFVLDETFVHLTFWNKAQLQPYIIALFQFSLKYLKYLIQNYLLFGMKCKFILSIFWNFQSNPNCKEHQGLYPLEFN